MAMAIRLLLVGYGRMGRLVDSLSAEYGFQVVGRLDLPNRTPGGEIAPDRLPEADVAVDFSTASALEQNFPYLAAARMNVVIGTTGWYDREPAFRQLAADAGIGVVAAPNCSLGVLLFQAVVGRAAGVFAAREEFGAWVHELHHSAKRDAPSGTARALLAAMAAAGYGRPIDVASTRAGSIPGTHTVGFDGPFESITLTHMTRDRATFARGALEAAKWVFGRRGWFTMQDVLGLKTNEAAEAQSHREE